MISVVIPTYNSAESLLDCISALLDQDFKDDYEIIVTDDGSTDKTPDEMPKFCKRNGRVHYFWHENVQRAKNRNIGVSFSNGETLIFLDADMLPIPSFISSHVLAIGELGIYGVICGTIPVDEKYADYPFVRYMAGKWERRLNDLKHSPADPFLMQSGNFSIHKEFFQKLEGFNELFLQYGGEDTDFFIRALKMGAVFGFCEKALAYQKTDGDFTEYANKYRQALASTYDVMILHPNFMISESINRQGDWKDALWKKWIRWKYSYPIMIFLLPILEKLPDRKIFFIYNSLLIYLKYHSRRKP
jgi:glycosyltransferase involved in cell wall biosynthesis